MFYLVTPLYSLDHPCCIDECGVWTKHTSNKPSYNEKEGELSKRETREITESLGVSIREPTSTVPVS
ncbi:hypothetical protein VNO77_23727 [Canavalia gladiata]|uniref:Uncharacterized protein n=1 Tax=Canavalia gladiata TaxID=3824 RepID=A0AAN9L7E5_CANGL